MRRFKLRNNFGMLRSMGCVWKGRRRARGRVKRRTDPWTTALIEIVYLQLRYGAGAEPEAAAAEAEAETVAEAEAGRGAVCLRAGRGNCICFGFCVCSRICFVFFSYYL